MGTGAPSLGVKWWEHEADHLPTFIAEIESVWSYTSTPLHAFMAQRGATLPVSLFL